MAHAKDHGRVDSGNKWMGMSGLNFAEEIFSDGNRPRLTALVLPGGKFFSQVVLTAFLFLEKLAVS